MKLRSIVLGLAASMLLAGTVAVAEEAPEQKLSDEEIAEMINNPLSYLWMIGVQSDFFALDGNIPGADKMHANMTAVMPVMSAQLTDDYKLIFRPWVPFISLDIPRNRGDLSFSWPQGIDGQPQLGIADTAWSSGVGDMGVWMSIASNEAAKPPFVWGLGVTAMFDTASSDLYGSGMNSAGPMGLAFYIGEEWIVGGLFQHWWDIGGSGHSYDIDGDGIIDKRVDSLSKSNLQYVIQYRIDKETNIGCTPNITYDWETDTYDIPVGLGMNTMIKLGPLPVKVGAEVQYHFSNNDRLHNEWQLRLVFVPVIPSPSWSREPLF